MDFFDVNLKTNSDKTSIRSSSSCLPLIPRLRATYILQPNFLSIMCFRSQFLHKM